MNVVIITNQIIKTTALIRSIVMVAMTVCFCSAYQQPFSARTHFPSLVVWPAYGSPEHDYNSANDKPDWNIVGAG